MIDPNRSIPLQWALSVLMGLSAAGFGVFILRFIAKRVRSYAPDGKGVIAHAFNSLYLPLLLGILTGGIRLTLITFPPGLTPQSWMLAVNTFLQFLTVLLGGEILFGLGADYYLREKRETDIPAIFTQLLKAILYTIVGLSFLSTTYKIDITPLLTTSAVFTAVIGLALQDVLMNLFSGISVHIAPPFKIGDWIKVGDYTGKVIESNWRATTLLNAVYELIVLPNNDIAKKDIVNLSRSPGRFYVDLQIGLAYETSPEQARQSLLECCMQVEEIFRNPSPVVYMEGFGDSSINYRLRYWIADLDNRATIRSKLASRVWYRLKRDGFTIPFPQRDVHIHPEKDLRDQVMAHRLALLSGVDFFTGLERPLKAFLADALRELVFESNEIIFTKNSIGTDFYIIDQGTVTVHLDEEGIAPPVATLGAGAFFGEMSILTGEPRSATLRAVAETRLLVLCKDSLGRALEENADLASVLSEAVIQRRLANQTRASGDERETRAERESAKARQESREASSQLLDRIRRFFRLR